VLLGARDARGVHDLVTVVFTKILRKSHFNVCQALVKSQYECRGVSRGAKGVCDRGTANVQSGKNKAACRCQAEGRFTTARCIRV